MTEKIHLALHGSKALCGKKSKHTTVQEHSTTCKSCKKAIKKYHSK